MFLSGFRTHHRVKQSAKSTTGMSSIAYVMLCGARDRSCGQQIIGASITTMLQHIPRTWFRFFGEKPDSCDFPGSLLAWYGSLWLLVVPQTQEAIERKAISDKRAKHHSERGFLGMFPTMAALVGEVCGIPRSLLWGWLGFQHFKYVCFFFPTWWSNTF